MSTSNRNLLDYFVAIGERPTGGPGYFQIAGGTNIPHHSIPAADRERIQDIYEKAQDLLIKELKATSASEPTNVVEFPKVAATRRLQ